MSYSIKEIEGIDKAYAVKLNEMEIVTTDDLLNHAATKKEREALAKKIRHFGKAYTKMGQPCRPVPHQGHSRTVCRAT